MRPEYHNPLKSRLACAEPEIALETLNAMIQQGWGDVRQDRIPANWREVPGPGISGNAVRWDHDGYVVWLDPLDAERLSATPDAPTECLGHQVLANEIQRVRQRRRPRRSWTERIAERRFSGQRKRNERGRRVA